VTDHDMQQSRNPERCTSENVEVSDAEPPSHETDGGVQTDLLQRTWDDIKPAIEPLDEKAMRQDWREEHARAVAGVIQSQDASTIEAAAAETDRVETAVALVLTWQIGLREEPLWVGEIRDHLPARWQEEGLTTRETSSWTCQLDRRNYKKRRIWSVTSRGVQEAGQLLAAAQPTTRTSSHAKKRSQKKKETQKKGRAAVAADGSDRGRRTAGSKQEGEPEGPKREVPGGGG